MSARTLAAAVVAMLSTTATASAATFCVPSVSAGCSGTSKATLADAITAANAGPDADDIVLAIGDFAGGPPVNYETHIRGAGRDVSTISGGPGTYGVYLGNPSSTISDVAIREPSGGPTYGLYLSGAAQRVTVDQRTNAVNFTTAVVLQGDGAFMDGAALASMATPAADYGIVVAGAGDALVSDVDVQGRYAITTANAGLKTVRFATIRGDIAGISASADGTLVDDSVVSGGPVVSHLFGGPNDITTTLRHVTLNGTYAGAESDNHVSKLVLSNTAIVGGGTDSETPDVELKQFTSGTARAEVDYSFFRAAHAIYTPGPNVQYVPGAHNVDGSDAKLVGLTTGNLKPRFDSPLVDAGDPVPGGGEPMADLAGEFRAVNGRTDIGAYEYGRHAPTIDAAVTPKSAAAGDTVTFSSGPVDADPGEDPVVTWAFDDGGTASGITVTHRFTTPGTHVATVTATDPVGLTGSATVLIPISAPPPAPKAMAPSFGFRKLTSRKGAVNVLLTCPVVAKDCAGTIELRVGKVVLGRARYRFAHGTRRAVKVRLTGSARRRLARARHGLRVKVVARPKGAAAKSRTVVLKGR